MARDLCHHLIEWVCAFANAEGGTLVIGRNDQGEAIGVPQAARLLEEIPNKARDLFGLVLPVRLVEEAGHQLLEIEVEANPTPISYRGAYFVRSGSTKQELRGPALSAFLLRRFGRHWDGAPLPGVEEDQLDAAAFATFRKQARRSGRLGDEVERESQANLLERLRLCEAGQLKRAAVLLFHEEPSRLILGAFVKIGYFDSPADLRFHDEVTGSVLHQALRTIDLLSSKYLQAKVSYEGLVRVETWPIPQAALRELVLNALVHKDYAVATPVQIRVYADRLTIWNPGRLPEKWTTQRLLREHASVPHNPDLANAFFRAGLIESWGRGIEKVLQSCAEAQMPMPALDDDGIGLRFELEFAPRYLALRETEELDSDGQELGSKTEELDSDGQELESKAEELKSAEPRPRSSLRDSVLALLASQGPCSKAELARALGQSQPSGPLHRTIRALVSAGTVTYTIPDKPASRNQRYALTDAGRNTLAKTQTQK